MRLSPSTLRALDAQLQYAYSTLGIRTIAGLADYVKRSRPLVYRLVRENPSAFPELSIIKNTRANRPPSRPTLLNEAQLRLLFNMAPDTSLLAVRRTARELFDLELLDTTAYKYIRLFKDGALFDKPIEVRGRKKLLDDEQFDSLVTFFRHPANALTPQAVVDKMSELVGRPVSRSTAYFYRRQVQEHLRVHPTDQIP